jgi:uncharacterized protein (TIGR02466 family)
MNGEILPLFPTPLYTSLIDVSSTETEFFKNSVMKQRPNGFISDNQYVLSGTPNVAEQIVLHAREFITLLGYNLDVQLTTSWVNLHKRGDKGRPHAHANSMISGVLFLDTPPNSGDFHLYSPASNGNRLFSTHMQADVTSLNEYNSEHRTIKPVSGQCVMFPSYLIHQVSENMIDASRWTVAFNFFAYGKIRENNVGEMVFQ